MNLAKPYAVLAHEADSAGSPWKGLRHLIQIRLYASRAPGTTTELDSLTESITGVLDKQLLADESIGNWITFFEDQSGSDIVDEERDAITRNLQFAVLSPRPLTEEVQVTSDPWLSMLVSWTQNTLGADWSVYSGNWPAKAFAPSILWRITEMNVVPSGPLHYEVRKRLTAFIQAQDANQEHAVLLQLVEALGSAVKIPLAADERKFVRVVSPEVSTKTKATGYEATEEGPLTVSLSRRTAASKLAEEGAPLMQFVHYESHLR
ncbi:hypothetical protein V3851_03680 [Paenibacillus sp. M1]|uniref:Uncharacterized protein n=1 Tax=Paenibacillus haidiansis TaxID=1574488 RepID=A0ABU7VN94_9BACL